MVFRVSPKVGREGGSFLPLPSPTSAGEGVLPYLQRSETRRDMPYAVRGLSPGTQKVLTLTEGQRVRHGLVIGRDVVPCITTLRQLPADANSLDEQLHREQYRAREQKCWLIRTDAPPSGALTAYLESVPPGEYQTSTCLSRETWWRFRMPPIPPVVISMSFKGSFPKAVQNLAAVRAVGGVYGIYAVTDAQAQSIVTGLNGLDIRSRIVAHSNGLRKIEVGQLNYLLAKVFPLSQAGT